MRGSVAWVEARRRAAAHRAAAEAVLARAEREGRTALTAAEAQEFDRYQSAMHVAIEQALAEERDVGAPAGGASLSRPGAPPAAAALRQELAALVARVEKPAPRTFDRRRMAIHEAGHVVAHIVRGSRSVRAAIGPDGGSCWADRVGADAVASLAGVAAERDAGYDRPTASDSDMANATAALAAQGKSAAWLPGLEAAARQLIATYRPAVRAVAGFLEMRGTAEDGELRAVVANAMRAAHGRRVEERLPVVRAGAFLL